MMNGTLLRDAIISATHALANDKQRIDALNIFPVPDGDTGTNMSMTMMAAERELLSLRNPTVSQVADVTAAALLRGARGNSGVILSLLFRGFSKALKGKDTADAGDLAYALSLGVEAAYKAVMKPTEGTILTVSREAADAGRRVAGSGADGAAVWQAVCDEAAASLVRTPDLLPVLKKAGVVDAGGAGFVDILEAMKAVFEGGAIVGLTVAVMGAAAGAAVSGSVAAAFDADIAYTYCTEYIVTKNTARDALSLRAVLESIGDCVVVVDDAEIIKVHVHTNDPGRALTEGARFGTFETVKVENMRLQHEHAGDGALAGTPGEAIGQAAQAGISASAENDAAVLTPAAPEQPYGFVSVAAGGGLRALFHDLGCAQVVSGGQTMNPSTEDILRAVEATPAHEVFVLPNNKNIIMAAEQAAPLADRKVYVLPTRTIPQGIAAMLAFDPEAPAEQNLDGMTAAADNVSTGQITFAARDSDYDGKNIKEGEILALDNNKLLFTGKNVHDAAVKLVKTLASSRRITGKSMSYLMIITGQEQSMEDAERLKAVLQDKIPEVDITIVEGGQPLYYYIFSLE